MRKTLGIDDELHRAAQVGAAASGISLSIFVENALRAKLAKSVPMTGQTLEERTLRNECMEALLKRTAHFRYGERSPLREEPGSE